MSAPFDGNSDEPVSGFAEPLLYNLVYCSRSTPGVDAAAVDRIIQSARRHNPARGITGLLVFGSGIFFQWLEGPRESVQGLVAKLEKDHRHESMVTLSESEEVRDRLFPTWDMELVGAEDIRDVLQDALETAADQNRAAILTQLLDHLENGPLTELGAA